MLQDFYIEGLEYLFQHFQELNASPSVLFAQSIQIRLEGLLPKKYGVLRGKVINLSSNSQAFPNLIIYANDFYRTPYPPDEVPYLPIEICHGFIELADHLNMQVFRQALRNHRSQQILNLDHDKKVHIIYCQTSDFNLESLSLHLQAAESNLSPGFHIDALAVHNKGLLLRLQTGGFQIFETTDALTLLYLFLLKALRETQTHEVDRLAYVDQGKVEKSIKGEPLYTDGLKHKKRGKQSLPFDLASDSFIDYYNHNMAQNEWLDFLLALEKYWHHPSNHFSSNYLTYLYRNFSFEKNQPEPQVLQSLYALYQSLSPRDL